MKCFRYFQGIVILIISQFSVISAEKGSSLLHFKCPYGNSDCLVKMYDLLIKELSDGKPEYSIPPLDPVYIKEFNIRTNFLGPFNVNVTFQNAKFTGVKSTTTKKFTGFSRDFDGQQNEIVLFTPKYTLSGKYIVNGTMFSVPIHASGSSTIILLNVYTRLRFITRKIEKNGEIYAQAEKMQMTAKFDGLKLEFDSIRSENKLLEEVAAEYVNTNWRESFNAAKESIYESFSEIWTKIYNQISSQIPYRDFFVEESA